MKTKLYPIIGTLALLLVFFIGRCTAPDQISSTDTASEDDHVAHDTQIWTCSMHPQIQQPEPGACPICGMDLIPLTKDSGADLGPRAMSMSESSRALADIETTLIERRFPQAEIRLVGKLGYDETKVKSLTARFPARIDELFVNFTGVPVQKGDHLARVYSPELFTAQSELLTAHRYNPSSSATQSAKEKLRLWDLLPEQIDEILENGEAKDHFELKAPVSGVVVSKNVNEGDYFKTGQSLFKIVDLETLWLRLAAFESDLSWLRFGQKVQFNVQAIPGKDFEGKITFIDPEIDPATRTLSIRVNVSNTDGLLKPGMFAKAVAYSQIAQSGKVYAPEYEGKWISPMHPEIVKEAPGQCDICGMALVPAEELGYVQSPDEQAPLVIPASAVLRTGKRAVVYIEKPNTDRPTFEGLEIELGPKAGDVFIVQSGLSEGDRVVTRGAFKIDSALQIQAKPSMMNPKGDTPPPVHDHGGTMQMPEAKSSAEALDPAIAAELMPAYFNLQAALAGDNIDTAKTALTSIMSTTGHSGSLPKLIHEMLDASSIVEMRTGFETLSATLIKSVSNSPNTFEGNIYQIHCPMAFNGKGADWLQASDQIKNPYLGATMLTCGEVTQEF